MDNANSSAPLNKPEYMMAPNGRIQVSFTTTIPFYELADGLRRTDVQDQIGCRMKHLLAMLDVGISCDSDKAQGSMEDYFWACRSIAGEIKDLVDLL